MWCEEWHSLDDTFGVRAAFRRMWDFFQASIWRANRMIYIEGAD